MKRTRPTRAIDELIALREKASGLLSGLFELPRPEPPEPPEPNGPTNKTKPEPGQGQLKPFLVDYLNLVTPDKPRKTIVRLKRTLRASSGLRFNRGALVSAMVQGYLPEKPFQKTKAIIGLTGTVLIDCSGSMDPSPEIIERLCALIPYGKIALYVGGNSSGPEITGVLAVVADKGIVSSDMRPFFDHKWFHGANDIDLPAVEWLLNGKHQKPLWFVSDLEFCGAGPADKIALNLVSSAVASSRLNVLNSLPRALDWFGKLRASLERKQ